MTTTMTHIINKDYLCSLSKNDSKIVLYKRFTRIQSSVNVLQTYSSLEWSKFFEKERSSSSVEQFFDSIYKFFQIHFARILYGNWKNMCDFGSSKELATLRMSTHISHSFEEGHQRNHMWPFWFLCLLLPYQHTFNHKDNQTKGQEIIAGFSPKLWWIVPWKNKNIISHTTISKKGFTDTKYI